MTQNRFRLEISPVYRWGLIFYMLYVSEIFQVNYESYGLILLDIPKSESEDSWRLRKHREKFNIYLIRAHECLKSIIEVSFLDFGTIRKLWPLLCRFWRKFMYADVNLCQKISKVGSFRTYFDLLIIDLTHQAPQRVIVRKLFRNNYEIFHYFDLRAQSIDSATSGTLY